MLLTMITAIASVSFAAKSNPTVPVELVKAQAFGSRAVKLSWNKVSGATKYVVYGQACDKSFRKLKTTSNTSYTVKKIKGKKLKAHKAYKFYVAAYRGKKKLVSSKSIHFITAKTMGKYANASRITAKYSSKTLAPGKTLQLGATVKIYKNKKQLPKSHGAKLRYISNSPGVASVSANGLVKAKSQGTAKIYIQDISGLYAVTTIYVKPTKKKTDKPVAEGPLTFNGELQTGVVTGTGYTLKNNTATDAGEYTATATLEEGYCWSDNTTAPVEISWRIAKANANVTADDKQKTVGENDPELTATVTGTYGSDTLVYTVTRETGETVGKYDITPSGDAEQGNYTVTYNRGTFTINPVKYTVTFDMQGVGTAPQSQTIEEGTKATAPTEPTDPTRFHTFAGWYKTKDKTTGLLSDKWDFDNNVVTADTTLYAQWTTTTYKIVKTNANMPEGENDNYPAGAWQSDSGTAKLYWRTSGNQLCLIDDSSATTIKTMIETDDEFIKNGDQYIYKTNTTTWTATLTDGVFTSLKYETTGNTFKKCNGTYTAP